MSHRPFGLRAAELAYWPTLAGGCVAAVLAGLSMFGRSVPAFLLRDGAIALAATAGVVFLTSTADRRVQNAISAANAEMRRRWKASKGLRRLLGAFWPDFGDRALLVLSRVLLVELICDRSSGTVWETALLIAGFALTICVSLALFAREFPTDRYVGQKT